MHHAARSSAGVRANALTRQEQILLSVVPPEHRASQLRLLRSPDRTVRGIALVLLHLDRDARHHATQLQRDNR